MQSLVSSHRHSCVLTVHCEANRVKRLTDDYNTLVQLRYRSWKLLNKSSHGKHENDRVTLRLVYINDSPLDALTPPLGFLCGEKLANSCLKHRPMFLSELWGFFFSPNKMFAAGEGGTPECQNDILETLVEKVENHWAREGGGGWCTERCQEDQVINNLSHQLDSSRPSLGSTERAELRGDVRTRGSSTLQLNSLSQPWGWIMRLWVISTTSSLVQ